MPVYVDVAPLAFVGIDAVAADFGFLCTYNSPDVIQGWIKTVRANGTKVLFSILDEKLARVPDPTAFAQHVASCAVDSGRRRRRPRLRGQQLRPERHARRGRRRAADRARRRPRHRPYLSAPIYSI